jgi:hypothetical protein
MRKRPLCYLKIFTLYISLPVVLFFIPVSHLDSLPSICIFRNLTGIKCPGCGMTRAVLSVLHLRFAEAFSYNKLIVLVFPLGLLLFLRSFLKEIKGLKLRHKNPW